METTSLSNQYSTEIEQEWDSIIYEYFLRLNLGKFIEVSELFSAEGLLYPPFEKAIRGRDAIAQYLQSEARGVQALPQSATVQLNCDGSTLYQIKGNVKTSFFTVNVGWAIQLNTDKEIVSVEVKLLAEFQDLLAIKHRE